MVDDRPSTHYQSAAVIKFNEEARRASLTGPSQFDLTPDALIAEAKKDTGLDRFGNEEFLPALKIFLEAIAAQAQLNPFGRQVAKSHTVRNLKNRLWANAQFEAHAEILERKITAPIIIVGPHRSGTTRLQRMLATDTRLQHLKAWEGINPAPRPGNLDLDRAERYQEVKKLLAGREKIYPDAFSAHPMAADLPEEEALLLNHSFCGFLAMGQYNIPGYYQWLLEADKTFAYAYMADLMRLISWSRGDDENKRWVLKNPQHMMDLDLLLKVFPDARLVFTHRDPLKTVGSVISLMWFYAIQHTDLACRARITDVWLDFCEQAARRCMKMRESIPASQQLDIHYEDMNGDWRTSMRRIYDFSGMELAPQVEEAMAAWLANSEAHHGAHRYCLEDFGLSQDAVDARMLFVREKYAIPHEASS